MPVSVYVFTASDTLVHEQDTSCYIYERGAFYGSVLMRCVASIVIAAALKHESKCCTTCR